MVINQSSGGNFPDDSDACYEKLASQEEVYLEETEEEVVAVLESYNETRSPEGRGTPMCSGSNDSLQGRNLDEQLDRAAQDLITGDSDDPPISEETVVEMIRMTHSHKKTGSAG